jgi:phage/plasmid-associated DNA primase
LKKTAQFKMLTGDDTIRAEEKFEKAFSFTPWCTPIFSANEQFSTSDHTFGFTSRWLPLVFPNSFTPGGAPDMESKFELEGIAVKAVHALRRLMDNGPFSNPPSAQKAKEEFIRNIDYTIRWAEENTIYEPDLPNAPGSNRVGTEAPRGTLYSNLRFWCEGEGVIPIGRNKFYLKLRNMGYAEVRSETEYYFRGLRLMR